MRLALLAALGTILIAPAVQAHHSLAGVYDSSRKVTIDAVVREFHFVNPHPYLLVDVMTTKTPPQRWRLELDNRSELSDIGMTATTFQPDDRIATSGSPGRTQPQMLYVRSLDRESDGFHYEQVGTTPVIRR
jgi:hypothetical protein